MNKYLLIVFATFCFKGLFAAPFTIPTAWLSIPIGKNESVYELQNKVADIINTITTEEVRSTLEILKSGKKISVLGFLKKPQLGISILYLTDKATDLSRITSTLETNLTTHTSGFVEIDSACDLFGHASNELVLKVAAPYSILLSLRNMILRYIDPKMINNTFPFVPHISLGKINIGLIQEFIAHSSGISKEDPLITEMINSIKQKTKKSVDSIVAHTALPKTISINAIEIYNFDRTCIKRIPLTQI